MGVGHIGDASGAKTVQEDALAAGTFPAPDPCPHRTGGHEFPDEPAEGASPLRCRPVPLPANDRSLPRAIEALRCRSLPGPSTQRSSSRRGIRSWQLGQLLTSIRSTMDEPGADTLVTRS